ncbi:hypothetical protein BC834DRAFT_408291 [Gloeopeniophorella convolvens]|nr:hypothetical protein BC834DRAFT_408291 [Gloeopeniophorella convolvens]
MPSRRLYATHLLLRCLWQGSRTLGSPEGLARRRLGDTMQQAVGVAVACALRLYSASRARRPRVLVQVVGMSCASGAPSVITPRGWRAPRISLRHGHTMREPQLNYRHGDDYGAAAAGAALTFEGKSMFIEYDITSRWNSRLEEHMDRPNAVLRGQPVTRPTPRSKEGRACASLVNRRLVAARGSSFGLQRLRIAMGRTVPAGNLGYQNTAWACRCTRMQHLAYTRTRVAHRAMEAYRSPRVGLLGNARCSGLRSFNGFCQKGLGRRAPRSDHSILIACRSVSEKGSTGWVLLSKSGSYRLFAGTLVPYVSGPLVRSRDDTSTRVRRGAHTSDGIGPQRKNHTSWCLVR